MDIGSWLRDLGLERYEGTFRDNEIDSRSIVFLTEEDLKELGIAALGHRRRLQQAIAELRRSATGRTGEIERQQDQAVHSTAERRQLTVVFCDLVGSTELGARLDPEEMGAIIAAFHGCIETVVLRFDGHVAKIMGDGALITFGYPRAHEDDPERAVRAALDIVAAMPELSREHGTALHVRVGIATGLVVVGDLVGDGAAREPSLVGNTPNLAARLQGLAEPDTVLVSSQTRRLLGETFTLRGLGARSLKGFEEEQVPFLVTGIGGFATRFEARSKASGGAMLGRAADSAMLCACWDESKHGHGQAVLLEGDAGVGKSRIVSEFQRLIAEDPHESVVLQCAPYSANTEFYPLQDYLWRRMAVARDAVDADKLDALESVLAQAFGTLDEASPYFAHILNIDADGRYRAQAENPQRRRIVTIGLLVDYFCGLATKQPLLLVVEDAHWVDPSTRDFLEQLVQRVPGHRLALTMTSRPNPALFRDDPACLRRHVLRHLGEQDAHKLVEEVAGEPGLSAEVKAQIIRRADGIPLFIEELTRSVLEGGIGQREEPLAIPATLQDSLMARLDRLGEARRVAQIAAALGRDFAAELLAASMSMPVAQLEPLIDQLIEADLLLRDDAGGREVFRFRHALVRDIAYETLLKSHRRKVHARIATALERTIPSILDTEPEGLAHHLTEADDAPRAIECWMRAGRRSYERSACKEAIHHFSKALELLARETPSPDRDRRELLLQTDLGSSIMTMRGFAVDEVRQAFARAFELCQTIEDGPETARVLRGLCWFYVSQSRLDMALDLANRLSALADRCDDAELVMVACQSLGIVQLLLGQLDSARRTLETGAGLFSSELHRGLGFRYGVNPGVNCLILHALSLWLTGFPDQARQRMAEADELVRDLEHPLTIALTHSWMARIFAMLGEPEPALRWAETAIAFSREQSIRLCEAEGLIVRGWARVAGEQDRSGVGDLTEGLGKWRATGAKVIEPYYLALLADAHLRLCDYPASSAALDEALRAIEQRGEVWWAPEVLRLQSELLRLQGAEPGRVEAALRQTMALARAQGSTSLALRAATSLARLWRSVGRAREAQSLLQERCAGLSDAADTGDVKAARELLRELS